ncbi:MAG: hypothetical protein EBU08_03015 [Micrococcales bacterium]|nr:hypothetical protein [Micrococcales bacterium]
MLRCGVVFNGRIARKDDGARHGATALQQGIIGDLRHGEGRRGDLRGVGAGCCCWCSWGARESGAGQRGVGLRLDEGCRGDCRAVVGCGRCRAGAAPAQCGSARDAQGGADRRSASRAEAGQGIGAGEFSPGAAAPFLPAAGAAIPTDSAGSQVGAGGAVELERQVDVAILYFRKEVGVGAGECWVGPVSH